MTNDYYSTAQMILFMDIPAGVTDTVYKSYKVMPRAEVSVHIYVAPCTLTHSLSLLFRMHTPT